MPSDPIQTQIDALDDLLDEEHAALLDGDLDRIARLHDRKALLIETLSQLEIEDQERLRVLGDRVERNQQLLNSALEGIKAVTRRLAAVRQTRENLDTYDAKGRKSTLNIRPSRSVEKRA